MRRRKKNKKRGVPIFFVLENPKETNLRLSIPVTVEKRTRASENRESRRRK